MKHFIQYGLYTLAFLLLLVACIEEPMITPNIAIEVEEESIEEAENNCWSRQDSQLIFTQLIDMQVIAPSKLALYFKLEDNNGRPIANLQEADFNIYEQTARSTCLEAISEFEAPRKVRKPVRDFSHNTLILLDLSGSVLANFSSELKEATKALVNEINPHRDTNKNKVGISWFDGAADIHQLIAPSLDKTAILNSIETIDSTLSKDNSTNLYGAVSSITAEANTMLEEDTNIKGVSILLFTDGKDRANRVSRQIAYEAIDNSNKAISFFSVGLGMDINEEDLTKFGQDEFVNLQEVGQLITTFSSIAQSVKDEANSYYLFEYCSPIRAGTDNIFILEAVSGAKKGFWEHPFSAEGFGGGCTL